MLNFQIKVSVFNIVILQILQVEWSLFLTSYCIRIVLSQHIPWISFLRTCARRALFEINSFVILYNTAIHEEHIVFVTYACLQYNGCWQTWRHCLQSPAAISLVRAYMNFLCIRLNGLVLFLSVSNWPRSAKRRDGRSRVWVGGVGGGWGCSVRRELADSQSLSCALLLNGCTEVKIS